jgi:hypothetical protein
MRRCSLWSGDRWIGDPGLRRLSPTAPRSWGPEAVGSASLTCLSIAPIAQSAERLHGKEKVYGSIPYWGSWEGVVR